MGKNNIELVKKNKEEDEHSDSNDSMIENGISETEDEEQSLETTEINSMKRKNSENSFGNAKKKQKKNKNLLKPPTVQEINQLRETENLFHSNLFRLQIDEMISEINFSPKYLRLSDIWLDDFNKIISNIASDERIETIEVAKERIELFGIKLPLKIPKNARRQRIKFIKPTKSCFIIGSHKLSTVIGPSINIDLCIEIPEEIFRKQKEIFLNGNYHYYRAIYLCLIATKLKDNQIIDSLKFSLYQNDPLKPILKIIPNGKIQKNVTFNLHVICNENSYKLNRFLPNINNVKFKRGEELLPSDMPPTPNYNSKILFDLTLLKNEEFLMKNINNNSNIQDAIKLLKIWLKQRHLDNGICGFTGYIISMFIIYLLNERKLFKTMSSYQIVRHVWNHLCISEWEQNLKGINLSTITIDLELYHKFYDIVFIDTTGYYNICSNLSLEIYKRVRYESKIAINYLDDKTINSFRCLFMINMPFYNQYDHIININSTNDIKNVIKNVATQEETLNYFQSWYQLILKIVTSLLRKGLNNRVLSMTPVFKLLDSWSINEPQKIEEYSLVLGLILNVDYAYDIIEKGPSADLPESNEFRIFWGDKSTLRRFKDGTITEAIVWSKAEDPLEQKRLICKEIVTYLFEYHLKLTNFDYIANQMDLVTDLGYINGPLSLECTALNAIRTFDEICKVIRNNNDLPLGITTIQGTSPIFRYCDIIPTSARCYIKKGVFYHTRIHHCVIQLVVSGKWPESLDGIRRIKAAFYINIGEYLNKNALSVRISPGFFDVFKDNFVFRFSMIHPKEIALSKNEVLLNNVKTLIDNKQSLQMEKDYVILPIVTSFLHGIYQQYPAFGLTVCMAKRWLYTNMLDPYLWPDECTELLIAHQFMKSEPFTQPCQPQLGFFRFIKMLAETDWLNELIFLNFNNEIQQDDIRRIEKKFTTKRNEFPPLCILTSCDLDKYGIWSKNNPIDNVLARVTLLARHSLEIIEKNILNKCEKILEQIFVNSSSGYNLIIKLNANFVYDSNLYNLQTKKYKIRKYTLLEAGLNFVSCYLQELREAYNDFALFFYNPIDGTNIYVLWRPEFLTKKFFKITEVHAHLIEKGNLVPNKLAVINDFKIIGKGLVEAIQNLDNQ